MKGSQNPEELRAQIAELALRLQEAEDTLRAIRSGNVDALVVERGGEQRVYTLEGAERPYRMWVENMQQGAATLEHGRLTYCNRRFAQLVAMAHEALLGATLRDFIAAADRPAFDALLEQGLTGGGQSEMSLRRADASEVPVLLTVNVLSLGGASLGLLATDLTAQRHHEQLAQALRERERLEGELRQVVANLSEADRRKSEFLAMLSHELRNPLAPISNALQVLHTSEAATPATKATLEMVQRHVGQMVRLIDDLLDVSRISRGRIELRKTAVDLTSIARDAVEVVRAAGEQRQLRLDAQMPDRPLLLHADPARLSQALGNLLHNAVKFTAPGGQVRVVVECDGADAVVRVRDDGIGLAGEQLQRVFELFAQVDTSLERAQGGLGIGLALVKSLVELHGGTVAALSDGIGHGSEFVVRLPISAVDAADESGPTPPPAAKRVRRRVLVVDDNRDAADSMGAMLELDGHDVRVAYDGLAAVEAAAAYAPELILLDIGLPGLNGFEAARRIRERSAIERRKVKLVALTGWGQDEDRRRSHESGFDAHLVKPVDVAALDRLFDELGGDDA